MWDLHSLANNGQGDHKATPKMFKSGDGWGGTDRQIYCEDECVSPVVAGAKVESHSYVNYEEPTEIVGSFSKVVPHSHFHIHTPTRTKVSEFFGQQTGLPEDASSYTSMRSHTLRRFDMQ